MEDPKQSIPLPIGGGLGQSAGAKRVRLPKMATVDNVRLDRDGVLRKSDGLENLAAAGLGSGTMSTLLENRGQPAAITTDGLFAFSEAGGAFRWRSRNTSSLYPITVESERLYSTGGGAVNVDAAFLSTGLGCVVWEERSTNTVFSVFIDAEGRVVAGPVEVGSGLSYAPRVVAVNGTFLVVAFSGDPRSGVSTVFAAEHTGSLTWNTSVSLGLSVDHFDIYADPAETLAYWTSPNLARALNSDGSTAHNVAVSNSTNGYIYHDRDAQRVIVAYQDTGTGDWDVKFLSEDLATTHSTTTLIANASLPSWHSYARGFVRPHGASNYAAAVSDGYTPGISFVEFNAAGSPVNVREYYGLCLHSRGAWEAQTGLVFGVHTAFPVSLCVPQYPGAFLVRDTDTQAGGDGLEILARLMDNPSPEDSFDWERHMTSLVDVGSGLLLEPATRALRNTVYTTLLQQDYDELARVDLHRIDTRASALASVEGAGGATLVAGGHVGFFDRASAVENSIHGAPEILDVTVDTSTAISSSDGSGSTASTQRLLDLSVALRWVDSTGRIHRTAPSNVLTWTDGVTITSDQYFSFLTDVTLRVMLPPTAVNGDSGIEPQIEVYATSYNPHGGAPAISGITSRTGYGGLRYLVSVITGPFSRYASDTNYVEVSTGGLSLTQSSVVSSIPEYVGQGELASEPTEPPLVVAATSERVFYLAADGSYVGASKPFGDTYATEFNAAQRILVPGGRGRALAVMDDYLVLFTEDGVFVSSASGGPDATGAGGSFAAFRRVPSAGGCVDRRSVVSTPAGVLFQGRRGIYMVSRGLEVSFVGADVQDETDGETVRATALLSRQGEALFLLSGGVVLAFNYEKQEWLRRTGMPEATLGVAGGLALHAHTNLSVFRQTPGLYGDAFGANAYVLSTLVTPWIPMAGPQGYQRLVGLWLLGQHFGGDLAVSIGYDYESTYAETVTYDEADLASLGGQVRFEPGRQKCQAFRLRLAEKERAGQPGTTNLGGYWLEELQIDLRPKARSFSLKGNTPAQ